MVIIYWMLLFNLLLVAILVGWFFGMYVGQAKALWELREKGTIQKDGYEYSAIPVIKL